MRHQSIMIAILALLTVACEGDKPVPADDIVTKTTSPYPGARRSDHVDDYFGTRVGDPYRWMEDLDAPEVKTWVDAQNEIAEPYLEALPDREKIRARTETLWSYERWSVPVKRGGRYFYEHDDGKRNQAVLYVTHELGAAPRVAIDPNLFSDDGTVAMVRYNISPDGRYIAYGLSDGGSDWTTTHIRDLETGEDLPEVLRHTKSGDAAWYPDSRGFVYSRYPLREDGSGDDTKQSRVYFHELGTPQTEDALVYEVTDHPRRNPSAEITEDGRYMLLTLTDGYFDNGVYYIDLEDPKRTVIRLLDDWDGLYEFLGSSGRTFYFDTTFGAPNHRIIAIDLDRPERASWREIVPEAGTPIHAAGLGGDHVVLHYLEDAHSVVKLVTLDGTPDGEIDLPGLGTVYGADENKHSPWDQDALSSRAGDDEIFFGFTGYTRPATVYRHSITQRQTDLFRAAATDFDAEAYETRQVFYESADGTRVPMFITHRKGLEPDGDQPTVLYGYGGFNVALTPSYSTSWAVWLEMGGIVAIPNLRGGGEYGKAWHEAGTKLNKQNVFDDFIAAAEWLIGNGYTRPGRLAIFGGSNGGLLVAAVMLQRPELVGAVIPAVGVLDMLRYHTASANARFWSTDYGLSEVEEEFRAQLAYSPVHNVEAGVCYPPTLIQTGDHDDRVVSWHSFKFGAELQHAQGCDNPVIVRIETRGGHGAGKPNWMRIEEMTDRFAFLRQALGMNEAR